MKTLLTTVALIFSITAANADDTPKAGDVLAGGPVFSVTQYGTYCQFTNFGTTSITPMSQELFEDTSTAPLQANLTCANKTAVAPNQTCIITASNTPLGTVSISCSVTFNASAKNVRGTVQVWDQSENSLAIVELR